MAQHKLAYAYCKNYDFDLCQCKHEDRPLQSRGSAMVYVFRLRTYVVD